MHPKPSIEFCQVLQQKKVPVFRQWRGNPLNQTSCQRRKVINTNGLAKSKLIVAGLHLSSLGSSSCSHEHLDGGHQRSRELENLTRLSIYNLVIRACLFDFVFAFVLHVFVYSVSGYQSHTCILLQHSPFVKWALAMRASRLCVPLLRAASSNCP